MDKFHGKCMSCGKEIVFRAVEEYEKVSAATLAQCFVDDDYAPLYSYGETTLRYGCLCGQPTLSSTDEAILTSIFNYVEPEL